MLREDAEEFSIRTHLPHLLKSTGSHARVSKPRMKALAVLKGTDPTSGSIIWLTQARLGSREEDIARPLNDEGVDSAEHQGDHERPKEHLTLRPPLERNTHRIKGRSRYK